MRKKKILKNKREKESRLERIRESKKMEGNNKKQNKMIRMRKKTKNLILRKEIKRRMMNCQNILIYLDQMYHQWEVNIYKIFLYFLKFQ